MSSKQKPPKPAPPSSNNSDSSTIVKITPYLYLGPRTATAPPVALAAGITHILSIGARPVSGTEALTYHRLGLRDTVTADLTTAARLAGEIISSARETGRPDGSVRILVHCVAAVSRSPAVIASYLVAEEGMSLREALGLLVRARAVVRPNDGFLRQLREMELRVRGEGSLDGVETLPLAMREKLLVLGIEKDGE